MSWHQNAAKLAPGIPGSLVELVSKMMTAPFMKHLMVFPKEDNLLKAAVATKHAASSALFPALLSCPGMLCGLQSYNPLQHSLKIF